MAFLGTSSPPEYGFIIDTQGRIARTSNTIINLPVLANVNLSTNKDYMICLANANSGILAPNVFISNTQLFFNPSTGTLTSVNFNTVSDISLKENIITIQSPVSIVEKLSGVEFNWKDNGKKASGFIAQEVEQFLPHLVTKTTEGIKTVNYQGIIAYLVETVKQLNDRIKKLENRVE